jgi:hypothetical protein
MVGGAFSGCPLDLQPSHSYYLFSFSRNKTSPCPACRQHFRYRWRTLLLRDIISPFRVFFYPIIFWAGLMVAGPANLLLFWNLTEYPVLGGSPYNFSTSGAGYANFAFVVGELLGLVTAGPFSDWVAARATQGNDGIREAEMRLPALILYGLLTAGRYYYWCTRIPASMALGSYPRCWV